MKLWQGFSVFGNRNQRPCLLFFLRNFVRYRSRASVALQKCFHRFVAGPAGRFPGSPAASSRHLAGRSRKGCRERPFVNKLTGNLVVNVKTSTTFALPVKGGYMLLLLID
jgi:hypothetical protein